MMQEEQKVGCDRQGPEFLDGREPQFIDVGM